MIENPGRYLEDFVKAGADWLGVHAEACVHLHRVIQRIKELGAKAVVALNPATPLCMIDLVLADVDMVLLMTVNPGFGGQAFIRNVLPKIRQCRRMIDDAGLSTLLQVDGGVNPETAGNSLKRASMFLSPVQRFSGVITLHNIRMLKEAMNRPGRSKS